MSMLTARVTRSHLSAQYKRSPPAPDLWHTNDSSNMLDLFALFLDQVAGHSAPVFTAKVQTCANMEGIIPQARADHTIAPGGFQLKLFVEPRNLYGRIHGIINARTLAGEAIGPASITVSSSDRWLCHDLQKHRTFQDIDGWHTNPPNQDTRVAWSDGCFVFRDPDLAELADVFEVYNYGAGDIIDGELVMEA